MNEALKILVVDDEELILNVFKEYLESTRNYTVFTAGDGLEAIEIIKKQDIDCCITDLCMPRLDGLELINMAHIHDNTIPFIVMTGYPSMDNAVSTLRNGVVDFLVKPVAMNQISVTIERVMRERSLFVENLMLKEETKKNERLMEVNKELGEKVREVETINLILRDLDRVTTSKDLFKLLVDLAGKITPCDEAYFCVCSREMSDPAIITSFTRYEADKTSRAMVVEEKIIKEVTCSGMALVIRESRNKDSVLAIPLKIRSRVFGVLVGIMRKEKGFFQEKHLYYLNFLTEKASFLIENFALYENIYENLFSALYAFVEAIEARDPYTKQHSARVTSYAVSTAETLGCSGHEIDMLQVAANLHDIGKIGIPDHILLKAGKLTKEEYEVIKKHPSIGSSIIGHFNMWAEEQKIIRHHHEWWNGNGYPDRLAGEEIPFLSRILSVADVYDALTSDRSYRKKLSPDVAMKIIMENAGEQFDMKIAEIFYSLYQQGEIDP